MPIIAGLGDPGSLLDLTAVCLNAADEPSDFMAFIYAGDALSLNLSAQVEVRQLVGRRRLIRTGSGAAALTESGSFTFPRCNTSQVTWLRSHVGALVCYRDHVGSKWFGVYRDLPQEVATAYRDRVDVKVSLEQITHTEAI